MRAIVDVANARDAAPGVAVLRPYQINARMGGIPPRIRTGPAYARLPAGPAKVLGSSSAFVGAKHLPVHARNCGCGECSRCRTGRSGATPLQNRFQYGDVRRARTEAWTCVSNERSGVT